MTPIFIGLVTYIIYVFTRSLLPSVDGENILISRRIPKLPGSVHLLLIDIRHTFLR